MSDAITPRMFSCFALVFFVTFLTGCQDVPRPQFTSVSATRTTPNPPPRVQAQIDPNTTTLSAVQLEWGQRIGSQIALLNTDGIPRTLSPNLPTGQPLTVTYTFNLANSGQPLSVGTIVDYQFRVTHSTPDGTLYFWSPRRNFTVTTPPAPPDDPNPQPDDQAAEAPLLNPDNCSDETVRVSAISNNTDLGATQGVISANGRFVAFTSPSAFDPNDTNNLQDVYRVELATGEVQRVSGLASVADDRGGHQPAISEDGRFVAFTSDSNFDPQDTNNAPDVYRRDMNANGSNAFRRVSKLASVPNDAGGNQPAISADGRFIAFTSDSNFDPQDADNAPDVYRRDINANGSNAFEQVSKLSSLSNDQSSSDPAISADGRFIAFTSQSNFDPQDTDNAPDVYRRDMNANGSNAFEQVSKLASLSQDEGADGPAISADGRFIAFTSQSNFDPQDTNNLDDVYRRDMNANGSNAFEQVSKLASLSQDRGASQPAISADGRFVAFASESNFDPQDVNNTPDVYLRDLNANGSNAFERITVYPAGVPTETNRGGSAPSVSHDAHLIAFTSTTIFEPQDTNTVQDVYVRCRE